MKFYPYEKCACVGGGGGVEGYSHAEGEGHNNFLGSFNTGA